LINCCNALSFPRNVDNVYLIYADHVDGVNIYS
jgi:hypothetical protein